MPNPYDPQNPAKPHYFGGREEVLRTALERMRRAKDQRQSGGILIHGHRGVGKTSLLNKIIHTAANDPNDVPTDVLVISRRLSRTTNDAELYQILNEELRAQVMERKNVVQRFAQRVQTIRLFELAVDVAPAPGQSSYVTWKTALSGLRNADFVLVAIDDADYLSPEALGELKTIVEAPNPIPVLLVVSGGAQFEEKLVAEYSPIARVFSGASFNLGKFTFTETKEVLEKPLGAEQTRWAHTAITELQRLTAGYPYLVQCLASAAYHEGNEIDESRVKNAIAKAVEIGRSWLEHEIPGASDEDVKSFARLASANQERLRSSEISVLGVSAPYIGRLVKLGVLKQINRGRYTLQKSPMIATYHILKRGLIV